MRPVLLALATVIFNVDAFPQPRAGEMKLNPTDGQQYVWIPPGNFRMGCSFGDAECLEDEQPVRDVAITKGFWLAQTVATMRSWRKYRLATDAAPLPVIDDHGHRLKDAHADESKPVNGGKNRLDSQKLWDTDRRNYAITLLENHNNPHVVRLGG